MRQPDVGRQPDAKSWCDNPGIVGDIQVLGDFLESAKENICHCQRDNSRVGVLEPGAAAVDVYRECVNRC